jgi:hypothetical protein
MSSGIVTEDEQIVFHSNRQWPLHLEDKMSPSYADLCKNKKVNNLTMTTMTPFSIQTLKNILPE